MSAIKIYDAENKQYGMLSNNYTEKPRKLSAAQILKLRIQNCCEYKKGQICDMKVKPGDKLCSLHKSKYKLSQKEETKEEEYFNDAILNIDGERWLSVTNYIYYNMIPDPVERENLRFSDPSLGAVEERFLEVMRIIQMRVVRYSSLRANIVKFENPKLFSQLVSTKKRPIIYRSNNLLLGKNDANQGDNFLGETLEKLRKDKIESLLYDAFLVERFLKNQSSDYNNFTDFSEYLEVTDDSLLDLVKEWNKSHDFSEPARDAVIQLYEMKKLEPVFVKAALTKNYQLLVNEERIKIRTVLQKIVNKIFDMYLDYIIEKKFPKIDPLYYDIFKQQQLSEMDKTEKENLKKEIFSLYIDGKLNSKLSSDINKIIEKIPSEDEILSIEEASLNFRVSEINVENDITEPIIITPRPSPAIPTSVDFVEFSPISYVGMLDIDGKLFPTVAHYITYNLIKLIPEYKDDYKAYLELLRDINKIDNNFLKKNL
jgi:hypothetical protein